VSSQFTSEFADVNGTRLYYEDADDGDEAVIFIHGFALDSRMWDDQFSAFASRFRVVRYDMRGFGRSDAFGEEAYSAVSDLHALMRALGISSASLVGLSLGGGLAIDFTLTYPRDVISLVLADSIVGGWQWSSEWDESVTPTWEAGRAEGADAARQRWLAMPLFAPALERPDAGARLTEMISDYSGRHWTTNHPQIYLDPPAINRLTEIEIPTLVVLGDRDEPDFHLIAKALTAGIAGATQVVIHGAGHMSNMESPEEFNQVVLDFLPAAG
jgi:3-oxoadipate enol-lactonase